jgi:hypothetical protein
MKPIHMAVVAIAVAGAALAATSSAAADQPFDRCPVEFVDVPGPEVCTFTYSVHRFYPAGTRCAFDVTVDFERTVTMYWFTDPDRAVGHYTEEGIAMGNGNTLRRIAHYTETASPPFVITDRGLICHYSDANGTVTMQAGYGQASIIPPLPDVEHGRFFDAEDFCAALA